MTKLFSVFTIFGLLISLPALADSEAPDTFLLKDLKPGDVVRLPDGITVPAHAEAVVLKKYRVQSNALETRREWDQCVVSVWPENEPRVLKARDLKVWFLNTARHMTTLTPENEHTVTHLSCGEYSDLPVENDTQFRSIVLHDGTVGTLKRALGGSAGVRLRN